MINVFFLVGILFMTLRTVWYVWGYWGINRHHCLLRSVLLAIDVCFPDVQSISTGQLASLPPKSYHLLDVRSQEEFGVSHIPLAILTLPADIDPDALIIVYCSIGWRSAVYVRQLTRMGFVNSLNLRGSLFLWAREGRSLEHTDRSQSYVVHPFNSFWGRLLPAHLRWSTPVVKRIDLFIII